MNPSNNATNHHRFRSNKSPHRDAAAADSDGDGGVKVEKLSKQKSDDAETLEKKSKIFIRLRTNKNSSGSSSSKCMVDDVAADAGDLDSAAVVEDVEESIPKTWNLRPRRAVNNINNDSNNNNNKGLNGNGGALKICGGAVPEIKPQVPGGNRTELTRSNRNGNDANNYDNDNDNNNNNRKERGKGKEKEKEKKVRFSIPLTKVEIEEDIYSLTGSKPARRPKKRAKHVQKQLDCLFPGMWLDSITPDCYKVHEAPSKG